MDREEPIALVLVEIMIMYGKPVIRGTRVTVEHILQQLAAGASPEMAVKEHSRLIISLALTLVSDRCLSVFQTFSASAQYSTVEPSRLWRLVLRRYMPSGLPTYGFNSTAKTPSRVSRKISHQHAILQQRMHIFQGDMIPRSHKSGLNMPIDRKWKPCLFLFF